MTNQKTISNIICNKKYNKKYNKKHNKKYNKNEKNKKNEKEKNKIIIKKETQVCRGMEIHQNVAPMKCRHSPIRQ